MNRWCQSHLLQDIAFATALNQHVAKNRESRPPYFHFLKLDLTPYLLLDSPSFFQRPLKMGFGSHNHNHKIVTEPFLRARAQIFY